MGSARHRSWSHTRGKLAAECPRALYFQYFPWGDEKQNIARFLKRAVSPDSLAGSIVHRHIALGLRQLLRTKKYPADLHISGLAEYEGAIAESRRLAEWVRSGRRPLDEGAVLFHHLYGTEDSVGEERGRQTIEACLTRFENSSALEWLKATNFDRWHRILTSTDDVPSFYARADHGFEGAAGLRIYAAYDLALHWQDELVLIDWKTGKRSHASESQARAQLTVYALWAMATRNLPREEVKAAAFWLQKDDELVLRSVEEAEIAAVVESIESADQFERGVTRSVCDQHGEVIRYEAERADFPPKPDRVRCGWCSYRSICKERADELRAQAIGIRPLDGKNSADRC